MKATATRSGRFSPLMIAVVLIAATTVGFAATGRDRAGAAVYATYRVTSDVSARSTPTAAPTGVYGIPKGAAFGVQCQVIGQPVGPRGNTLYFLALYQGRSFYIPDTWTDSPHLAGQPPIAGIPMCGSTPPPPAPPPPPASNAVWIGSPVDGTWAWYEESLPARHHLPYGGDWSVDLPTGEGQPVNLYAAPQVTSLAVDAVVETVGPACGSGRIQDGGYKVVVGLFSNRTRIGGVTYAHLNPTVRQGQSIPRWGAQIGTVGRYTNNGCWAGSHTHVELYSQTNYACFNKGFALRQKVVRTNFIGFIGGNFARGTRAACP